MRSTTPLTRTLWILLGCLILALAGTAAAQDDAAELAPAADVDVEAPAVQAEPTDLDLDAALGVADELKEERCIQITVWATNPDTGECREFSSPCSVPPGWELSPPCGF